jgi:hypothetical protein
MAQTGHPHVPREPLKGNLFGQWRYGVLGPYATSARFLAAPEVWAGANPGAPALLEPPHERCASLQLVLSVHLSVPEGAAPSGPSFPCARAYQRGLIFRSVAGERERVRRSVVRGSNGVSDRPRSDGRRALLDQVVAPVGRQGTQRASAQTVVATQAGTSRPSASTCTYESWSGLRWRSA